MTYVIEREGKPVGIITLDDKGATISFDYGAGLPVVVRAVETSDQESRRFLLTRLQ